MRCIVSDAHRFVYFITQKVACSSVKTALLPLFPIDRASYVFTNRRGVERMRIHKAFDDAGLHMSKDVIVRDFAHYEPYYRFGFVRNPWDRLVSCYTQKLNRRVRGERDDGLPLRAPFGDKNAFRIGMTFEEFIERVHGIPDEESDVHFRAQTGVLYETDTGGRCLVEFVGRFERIAADFAHVADVIAPGTSLVLPHDLKTRNRKGRPYQEFYDARTRRLVEERFAADIDHFKYTFAPLTGSP